MPCIDDPAELTPAERRSELAALLAAGFLRLRKREAIDRTARPAADEARASSPESPRVCP
jgi:hypothetical protein